MATDDDYEIISAPTSAEDDYEIISLPEAPAPAPVSWSGEYSPEQTEQVLSGIQASGVGDLGKVTPQKSGDLSQTRVEAAEQDLDKRTKRSEAASAIGRGGAAGVTAGWSDELAGGAEALWQLAQGSSKEDFSQLYKKYRDEQRLKNAVAETNYPTAYGAAKLGGTVASSLLLPGGVASVAAQGAAQGLGDSDTEDYGSNLRDAAIGGVVGGTVGKVLPAAGKLVARGGTALRGLAEDAAESAAGGAVVGASKFPQGTGRELLDRGVVSFGGTSKTIAEKAAAESKTANKAVQTALDDAGRTPALANSFKENKRLADMMNQVVPAAETKANQTLGSSPIANAIDLATIGGGAFQSLASGNLVGAGVGTAAALARRLAAPRAAASAAASTDWVGKVLQQSPGAFGPYGKALDAAIARGGTSLAATIFALKHKDPKFNQMYQKIQEMVDASNGLE